MNRENLIFCPKCGHIMHGNAGTATMDECGVEFRDTGIPIKDKPPIGSPDYKLFMQKIHKEIIEPLGMLDKESERYKRYYNVQCLGISQLSSTVQYIQQPKCPTCGSTSIRKISTTERAGNALMFGLLGNKRRYQFECMNPKCKYKW